MDKTVEIKESAKTDLPFIQKLHRETFGKPEGESISILVKDLIEHPSSSPFLSLIAKQADQIIGHILFTTVTIEGFDVQPSIKILAPLAVSKNAQGHGIGASLIKQGLQILKDDGTQIVLVLGDPKYYSRFGFNAEHSLKPPHKLEYPEAWMAKELITGALATTSGVVKCATPLNAPEHW